MIMNDETFRVSDIFESISGEIGGFPQGTWVTVLRLQGCSLHCSYCDTSESRTPTGGRKMTLSAVTEDILQRGNKYLLITGGEPLEQPLITALIDQLQDYEVEVQVETNGNHLLPVLGKVHWVVDQKCPSSGMDQWMIPVSAMAPTFRAIKSLGGTVCLKFVVSDETDVNYALDLIEDYIAYDFFGPFAISPVDAQGTKIEAIVKQIKERLPGLLNYIVFSVQLHKLCDMR